MTTPKPELRMVAYYYSFGPTGVQEIDLILSAVACAGKASHHTNAWQDDTDPYPGHTGGSPIEWIQNAGRAAADALTRARSREEQAGRERDAMERQIDEFAIAIGYGTRPDGQSGVERPSLAYVADLIKDERQEHTEALEFQTWAAEELDQWREGEDHMGPLDDALTAALDELEAKRAEVERLKAQIDRMRQRIQELEEHHG